MKHFSFAQHWEGMVEADTLHVEMPSNTSRLDAHGTTSQVSQAPTKSCDSPAMCLNSSWFGRSRLSQIYNAPTMAHRSRSHRYQIGMSLWCIVLCLNLYQRLPNHCAFVIWKSVAPWFSLRYILLNISVQSRISGTMEIYGCTLRIRTEYSGLKNHSSTCYLLSLKHLPLFFRLKSSGTKSDALEFISSESFWASSNCPAFFMSLIIAR